MRFPSSSICASAATGAIVILLLGACSPTTGTFGGIGAGPAGRSAPANVLSGSSGLVLQTLDVPLSQFPKAVGTLLTGIRGNLITGFIDKHKRIESGRRLRSNNGRLDAD